MSSTLKGHRVVFYQEPKDPDCHCDPNLICKRNCYLDCDCDCQIHTNIPTLDIKVLKTLTGGDSIKVRSLYKKNVQ
jgi:hypothetical protein